MANTVTEDLVLGGLYGLLVGDAVGVPYEFSTPEDLPAIEHIDIDPPSGFLRAHPAAPKAAWSDDGAQALCLLASLLHCAGLDLTDLGNRLVNWLDWGYMAVDNVVFDVGNQTGIALSAIRSGVAAEDAGPADERHNGNGSLMRVLPLALWHTGPDDQLIHDAARQSIPTHAHTRSQVCCALYCLWARATLLRLDNPWQHATTVLRRHCVRNASWSNELEIHVRPDAPPGGSGSGYVVDCLHSARLAVQQPTFERVVQRAISLGNDTDTTAAVAAGIAGLQHGLTAIPERWRLALPARAIVDPLAEHLLASLRERARAAAIPTAG
jgi:ADP-ribosyl-[dinitrogen reductase] hydrolase